MVTLRPKFKQRGQTLVETMVAVFILIMGISAALGLANYSLGVSTNIRKQIIAMGLAREGIEAVKSMRDTNWLQGNLSTNCYNYASPGDSSGICYQDWLNPGTTESVDIYPGATSRNFALWYDVSKIATGPYWRLTSTSAGHYGLDYVDNGSDSVLYSAQNLSSVATATSDFARRINVSIKGNPAPFDQPNMERLLVTVEVWWKDKKCPASEDTPPNGSCLVRLQTYLTNWRDF